MDIRVHWHLPHARIEMIAQFIRAFFYAAIIAVVDALLASFGPIGRLPYRNVCVTSRLSAIILIKINADRVQTWTIKQTMKS